MCVVHKLHVIEIIDDTEAYTQLENNCIWFSENSCEMLYHIKYYNIFDKHSYIVLLEISLHRFFIICHGYNKNIS